MARTAVNFGLTSTSSSSGTWTVPSGKILIGKATGSANVQVNGVTIAFLNSTGSFGPICANAGDVISNPQLGSGVSGSSYVGLTGFLYDA